MTDSHMPGGWLQTLDPAVTTSTRVAMPIDRQGYEHVEHVCLIGMGIGMSAGMGAGHLSSSTSIFLTLEESDDGTTWLPVLDDSHIAGASVDDEGAFAVIDDLADTGLAYCVRYVGDARFSRLCVVVKGCLEKGVPIGAIALPGHSQ